MGWPRSIKSAVSAVLLLMTLTGCVVARSGGQKVATVDKPIERIAVLVQYASFEKGNTASSIGNRDVADLFPHLATQLPKALALNHIASEGAYVGAADPLPPALAGYPHLLRVWPQTSTWSSQSGSTLRFGADLTDRSSAQVVWRGSILFGTLAHGKYDAALADQLSAKLLEQLRHDGVITTAANQGGTARQHVRQVPPASGFAAIADVDAVPLRPEGKERFRHYLTLAAPKAFIIYDSGGWRFWSNDRNAMTNALDQCAREGKACWLYAVDDRVVWQVDVDKRVGKSAQLLDR